MKRLIPFLFILGVVFSCSEEFDISTPNIQEEQKTASIILNNIPSDFKGDSVYIFTLDNENEFYSATQATATEDAVIKTAVPAGNSSFSIIAYIPTVKDWTIEDAFAAGWYSSISGATNKTGRYITNEWDQASNYNNSNQGGATDVLTVDLYVDGDATLSNNEFEQGYILELEADITNNLLSPLSSISFAVDGTVIEEVVEEPYEIYFNTVDLEPGLHVISVTVANADSDEATDEMEIVITVAQNEAPTVNISGIINGATYERQSVRTIASGVSDENGLDDIDRVEFIINGTLVATVTEAPFSYIWDTYENAVGAVTIEVTAYDKAGAKRSDFVNVTLIAPENYAPRVNITSPSNGGNITIGNLITISTTTSDDEGDAISSVEFFFDNLSIGEDFEAPFTLEDFNTAGYAAGEYKIIAKVYGTGGSSYNEITVTLSE
ncbi:hypothetical protein C9994_11265 [Marivirga lumbricoides]|uniref:Cadherin domain-containing protein n=1 Tax=Marivirga lumbricoides TaxID=1046115 RepID=A0A2T4DNP7_9BACT|nr:hypothetical protein C9994_11265 [Marivirga lumbricoides]